LILLLTLPVALNARAFYCEAKTAVSLDHYKVLSTDEGSDSLVLYSWIIDLNRGWRRSDVPAFSGACESDEGYVVCESSDLSYGEANFSIHPDGSKFTLVFVDYGLGSLTFVGTCSESSH